MTMPDESVLLGIMLIVEMKVEAVCDELVHMAYDDWEVEIKTSSEIPVFFLVTLRCLSGASA